MKNKKLSKTFEKSIRLKKGDIQNQLLIISVEADSDGTLNSYDDVIAELVINVKVVAEISSLLYEAGVFINLVDSIDWEEQANIQDDV
jgi:hypothetical protein